MTRRTIGQDHVNFHQSVDDLGRRAGGAGPNAATDAIPTVPRAAATTASIWSALAMIAAGLPVPAGKCRFSTSCPRTASVCW